MKTRTKIFAYNGDSDVVFPASIAKKSYQVLKDKGFNVIYNEEKKLDHSLSIHMIDKLSVFFEENMLIDGKPVKRNYHYFKYSIPERDTPNTVLSGGYDTKLKKFLKKEGKLYGGE